MPLESGESSEVRGEGLRTRPVTSIAFSPDGRTLASTHKGGEAGIIRFWDVATRRRVELLPPLDLEIYIVAFSPDGRALATAYDSTVILWDTAARESVAHLKHEGAVVGMSYSPDGKLILTGGHSGAITLWDISTRPQPAKTREVSGSTKKVMAVAFSPDGQSVAACFEDGTVKMWDKELNDERVLAEGGEAGDLPPSTTLAFSPDGRLLAVGLRKDFDDADPRVHFGGGFIRLWRIRTEGGGPRLEELPPLKGHRGDITSLAFSKGALTLYSSSDDGAAKLWDTISFREVVSVLDETTETTASAFSPDGRLLASGDERGNVRLLRSATKDEIKTPSR